VRLAVDLERKTGFDEDRANDKECEFEEMTVR
jgi:hypothetical protein